MSIRGISKNIIFDPIVYKDLDEHKNLLPTFIDLRNVVLDDRKSINKRPGYIQDRDLGVDKPINALIPEGPYGYAITEDGRIFQRTQTSQGELTGQRLAGLNRPLHEKWNGTIAIVDGGTPVKISGGNTSMLGTSFQNFKYLALINQIMVYAGHNDFSFEYSANGNIENILTGDSSGVNGAKEVKKDGIIKNIASYDNKLIIFKDNSIERWNHIGGSLIFARTLGLKVGMSASYSLLFDGDSYYWLDENFRLRRLDGGIRVSDPISTPFDSYIKGLTDHKNIYGLYLKHDDIMLWQFGTSGKTLAYDIKLKKIFEWNKWKNGTWERMPFASYMEINNKRYAGSYNLEGLIYELSEDYQDDNGDILRCFAHFKVKFSERDRQTRYSHVKFRLKRGVATSTVLTPEFAWRYKTDQGEWQDWMQVDMGTVGVYTPYQEAFSLGIGVEIDFQVASTNAVEFKISDMILIGRVLGR